MLRNTLLNSKRSGRVILFGHLHHLFTTHTASLENRSVADEGYAISFVSDTIVLQMTLASEADFNQVEEFESESDDR